MRKKEQLLLKKALAKHEAKFEIKGKSMMPFYPHGTSVTIIDAEKLNLGDIVVFTVNGQLVFHRVVFAHRKRIITKGDANPKFDAPLRPSEILGKLKFRHIFARAMSPLIALISSLVGVAYMGYSKLLSFARLR